MTLEYREIRRLNIKLFKLIDVALAARCRGFVYETTTATATGTVAEKRINEQNNGSARAL